MELNRLLGYIIYGLPIYLVGFIVGILTQTTEIMVNIFFQLFGAIFATCWYFLLIEPKFNSIK